MTVALIAGEGLLPEIIASRLAGGGEKPLIYAIRENCQTLLPHAREVIPLLGAQMASTMLDMMGKGVRRVIFAGLTPKTIMYRPEMMDRAAAEFIDSLPERDDHALLGAIVAFVERAGIEVSGYRELLSDMLAAGGLIAGRPPTDDERADVSYGVGIARKTLPLSFGQSVVVSRKAVVAVEAMEGTDETVKRAGALAHGGVLVKMIKQGQDERYDLPVVGPRTLLNMGKAGLTCLAVHTGWTLVLSPREFERAARDEGISVIGVDY
jgi:DUF1009 family protein